MDITNASIIINSMPFSILTEIVLPLVLLVVLPIAFIKNNIR